ncbi:hypothetical protein D5071_03710 [Pectobacterium carotovorum]|uniref:Uncharacterized protein n=1 Tax=Pectobacterium carotovorum TaxID=554 RepID=A0A419AZ43_PECCA|nr:hypothetical protein D5071_03710 [Pectobacterium carotovorum]
MARPGGLVCRKGKLKNFYDPKTAGGCGVVPILLKLCFVTCLLYYCVDKILMRRRSVLHATINFLSLSLCSCNWERLIYWARSETPT